MIHVEDGLYWNKSCNPFAMTNCVCPGKNEVLTCWAMEMTGRNLPNLPPGYHPERIDQISRTSKKGYVYYFQWLGDICHKDISDDRFNEMLEKLIDIDFARAEKSLPPHQYLILTKRPERLKRLLSDRSVNDIFWIGTSAGDAANFFRRVNPLMALADKGWNTWLSLEPLVSHIPIRTLDVWLKNNPGLLRQVIVGAENGDKARPTNLNWVRQIRDYCNQRKIPFFFKNWGRWIPVAVKNPHNVIDKQLYKPDNSLFNYSEYKGIHEWGNGTYSYKVGKRTPDDCIRLIDNKFHNNLAWNNE